MRETILRFVNSCSGIIAQKLLLEMQTEYGPKLLDVTEFQMVIDQLVEKGSIVRVQFVIGPNGKTGIRTGALYLPERSVVIVNTPYGERTIFRSQK